jgi:hypothetical protein
MRKARIRVGTQRFVFDDTFGRSRTLTSDRGVPSDIYQDLHLAFPDFGAV